MRKIKFKKNRKLQPNKLEYTGSHKKMESEMQLFVYDAVDFIEYADIETTDLKATINDQKINWLNLHGLNEMEIIEAIGAFFKIDNFLLSDILNTTRRTKLEESPETLFFNIKSMLPTENSDNISVEQISFLIKNNILISFQEKRSDFFSHIRERIRTHSGNVRNKKADFLLYLLLDAVMENFYVTIENEEDKVEELINLSKNSADPNILIRIEKHRDNFNFLKRAIIPLRDSLYAIKSLKEDEDFCVIESESFGYFSRLHQKSLELLEQIESDMGMLESASSFFFSSQSHKMNEIMKTLTIVSAIFIPLTFIVGVYGMNFEHMPELKYQNGYYTVIAVMVLIGIIMIFYFKKRKWF
ncbi:MULTISPECIES: magnesium/cobalt transporter CorA [unclassified Flavobacterium]|uniref:magnesium/cobalt transporter CorA n=1 Tax=unclassified Flavobacterium TaxID=196869 RepID=UPI00156D9733|nr:MULTISPECIES: magnesium/cobalt transporter CorA [unclassified Flavobacterium]MBE0392269.1 Cobalt/magnesium transport protein CorA [Flavobacterium sp. PL002]NRT15494.1 magnesium transporter [Flavobacterium sp. 28A]